MFFHDPRREVEKLREILASKDLPIAFLVGAGTSCAVKDSTGEPLIPAIAGLGAICRDAVARLGAEHTAGYDAMIAEIDGQGLGRPATVEDILDTVRGKILAMTASDLLSGTKREQFEQIEECMRHEVATAAMPDESRIPQRLPTDR